MKTSIKKNLYYEIKEKTIEEAYNGVRIERKKAKVKVYGLDSTKDVRARLIELLHERVNYHKDKFISKVLHHEMETLEVDNKGKTQAIYPNHDDQVFSYLMAIYVWYDGKNISEFGIQKNVIKTDQDEEILDGDIESAEETTTLDVTEVTEEYSEDLKSAMNFIEESSKFKTHTDYENQQYEQDQELFNRFLLLNKDARKAYEDKYHVESAESQIINGIQYIRIPDNMFGNVDPDDDILEENNREKQLHGNLYSEFIKL